MQTLDRAFFRKDVELAAARVADVKQLSRVRNALHRSRDIFVQRQVTPVRADPTDASQTRKCILLQPKIKHDGVLLSGSTNMGSGPLLLACSCWSDRSTWGKAVTNLHNEAHFNLRDRYLPFKHLIGQVTIDKNAAIKTVINKTDTLHSTNEYRVLDYEIIAGEPNLDVEVREACSVFRFDFSKVFWNSKLSTEHQRLVDKLKPGEVVCDVMAGVGPFTVPAGKKGVFVWANDLNPDCFHSLSDAVTINKVKPFVRTFNQDGHAFIRFAAQQLLAQDYGARVPQKISRTTSKERQTPLSQQHSEITAPKIISHYIMNLPATAVDFLPDFIGLYRRHEAWFQPHGIYHLPLIHCYCFGPKLNSEQEDLRAARPLVWEAVSSKLGFPIDPENAATELHSVRDVAPNKRMFCATFRLPAEVAFSKT
ncbi:MAG: hypothetical protein Q9162_003267 [Coniocarpon cinnabarinum]